MVQRLYGTMSGTRFKRDYEKEEKKNGDNDSRKVSTLRDHHFFYYYYYSIIARFGLSSWRVIVKTFGDESRNKQCYSRPYLSRIFTMTYTISQSLTSMELCAELEVIFRNSAHSSQGDL